MDHIWTYDARKREGQIPLLPESSCVVFDEGHLVEYAAQKALTYRLKQTMMEQLLTRLLQNDIREEFAHLVEETIWQTERFFDVLQENKKEIAGSDRLEITVTEKVTAEAKRLYAKIGEVGDALVFESEMHTVNTYDLNIVDEHLDVLEHSFASIYTREKCNYMG